MEEGSNTDRASAHRSVSSPESVVSRGVVSRRMTEEEEEAGGCGEAIGVVCGGCCRAVGQR